MKPGIFRFQMGPEKISETSAYCFQTNQGVLQSANCEDGNCLAKKMDVCALKLGHGAFGTAGAKICEKLGGYLQIGAYYDGKEWWDTDRCLFPEDKSYLDSGSLSARFAECFEK